ncbi:deubiquitinating protein VCPIP1-like [Sycon ciliatum]|uniref:deubiquitinating protein VCPIP1-like n=1 Tax=Sycon ciliatum TaxID=27933 RepID=UPI0031F6D3F0
MSALSNYVGSCPDCGKSIVFNSSSEIIECPKCDGRHKPSSLTNTESLRDLASVLKLLNEKLLKDPTSSSGHDPGPVKILGLSSYECKLLSPLLTNHGMDKSGNAKLLTELRSKSEIFDFSALGDRSFVVDVQHLDKVGYGVDKMSFAYLSEILEIVYDTNNKRNCLVPLHADGDGHCLVHAISRCLVGRELFWHALRMNLHKHLCENLDRYKLVFSDFMDSDRDEWREIVDEAHPNYRPSVFAADPTHGLRPIHIFGLANVLRRPIILLDGMKGLRSSCEYTGVYLPVLYPPEECCGKARTAGATPELNRPVAIAWSSNAHNHYVPLIVTQGNTPVKLPADLVPKVSITGQQDFESYVNVGADGSVVLGAERSLSDAYLTRLITAMRALFMAKSQVSSALVADVYHYAFRAHGAVHIEASDAIDTVRQAAQENRLRTCTSCRALTVDPALPDLSEADRRPGGMLHKLIAKDDIILRDGKTYSFPSLNVNARYESARERFTLVARTSSAGCSSCGQSALMRATDADGSVQYKYGDRTLTEWPKSNCPCGYKHFFAGHEYENFPYRFEVVLDWNDTRIPVMVDWFDNESDPEYNSNAYKIASELVNKHFPADFGSTRLMERVVQQIFRKVESNEKRTKVQQMEQDPPAPTVDPLQSMGPMKTIFVGHSKTTLHKEELGVSDKEKQLRQSITDNASSQRRKSSAQKGGSERPAKRAASASAGCNSPQPMDTSAATTTTTTTATTTGAAAASASPSSIRVRVCMMPGGKSANLEFVPPVMPENLQSTIATQFDVPVERQRLRVGFPPRELQLVDGEPVQLKHGDKLSVEEIQPASEPPPPRSPLAPFPSQAASSLFPSHSLSIPGFPSESPMNPTAIMDLIALMDTNADHFAMFRDRPDVFEGDGILIQIAKKAYSDDMTNNKHVLLQELPNKVFVLNKAADRLEMCVGDAHIPMQHVTSEHIRKTEALRAAGGRNIMCSAPLGTSGGGGSVMGGVSGRIAAGGSGVVSSAAKTHHDAFTGHGHRMTEHAPAATGLSSLYERSPRSQGLSTSSSSSAAHATALRHSTDQAAASRQWSLPASTTASAYSSQPGAAASATSGASTDAHSPVFSSQTMFPTSTVGSAATQHSGGGAIRHAAGRGRGRGVASAGAVAGAAVGGATIASAFASADMPMVQENRVRVSPNVSHTTWSPDSASLVMEVDIAGVSSPEDSPPCSDGSEGEEIAYKEEKPRKRQFKSSPSSLVVHALEQRIVQLTEQTNILQAKLVQCSDGRIDDPVNMERKKQLTRQMATLQTQLDDLHSQRVEQTQLASNAAIVPVDSVESDSLD